MIRASDPQTVKVTRTSAVQVVRPAAVSSVVVTREGPPGPAGSGGGGGGGYVPGSDWLHVYAFAQNQTTTGGYNPEFVAADDPPPRGTAITWSSDAPANVLINEDGVYDVAARMWLRATGGDPVTVFAEVMYDDDNAGPFYAYDVVVKVTNISPPIDVGFAVPGVAIPAGKVLQLYVDPGGDEITVVEAVMTVSRIA